MRLCNKKTFRAPISALRPCLTPASRRALNFSAHQTQHTMCQRITPPILTTSSRRCTFCRVYGPKYSNYFSSAQLYFKVNSPLNGFFINSIDSCSGRFLPSTYINLVMAASVVIS